MMADLRQARADAVRRRLRDIADDTGRLGDPSGYGLTLLLDDLDVIDREEAKRLGTTTLQRDAEVQAHFAATTPPPDPEEPKPRRRTTRRAAT